MYRRDSFITHRAFCDALAQESAKALPEKPPNANEEPKTQAVASSSPPPTPPAPPPATEPQPPPPPAPKPLIIPAVPPSTSVMSFASSVQNSGTFLEFDVCRICVCYISNKRTLFFLYLGV